MEEVSQRSSIDDYGGPNYGTGSLCSSLLEPTVHEVHDVMSIEMGQHDIGGSYLDPRSFGGVGTYDDFSVQPPATSMYEISPYEQPSLVQSRSQYSSHSSSSQDLDSYSKYDPLPVHSQSQTPLYEPTRSPQNTQPQRSVPTYPVKTADPSICTQYAPVRTGISMKPPPPRRSSANRTAQKKEPIDPKRVEDEVARNVSQILSATKQQKLVQEAQQRCGIVSQAPRLSYFCPDCGKSMTSQRNLQRHRQASCSKKMNSSSPEPGSSHLVGGGVVGEGVPMGTLPGMDTFAHGMNSFSMQSESNDWCSSDSFSPSSLSLSRGRLDSNEHLDSHGLSDPACLPPLSLDADDSRTHSSSASHCSSGSNGGNATPHGIFTCGSCKKSVCSFRSLKRHHTTCKQYIAEFGLPESDPNKTKKKAPRKRGPPKVVPSGETAPYGDTVPPLAPQPNWQSIPSPYTPIDLHRSPEMLPVTVEIPPASPQLTVAVSEYSQLTPRGHSSFEIMSRPASSGSSSGGRDSVEGGETAEKGAAKKRKPRRTPRPSGTHNTCVDCNRQLCSASNLKRHRATCKAALQRLGGGSSSTASPMSPATLPVTPTHSMIPVVDIPDSDRSIIDRSYAAAIAASEESRQRSNYQSTVQQPTNVISEPIVQHKPWFQVTVGEHLRAQHVQQKMMEAAGHSRETSEEMMGREEGADGNTEHGQDKDQAERGSYMQNNLSGRSSVDTHHEQSDRFENNEKVYHDDFLEKGGNFIGDDQDVAHAAKQAEVDHAERNAEKWSTREHVEKSGTDIKPLDSIITTQPLTGDRVVPAERPSVQAPPPSVLPVNSNRSGNGTTGNGNPEFQCPECKKTYSCRKNVKRHRMAVHKLTAEDVARFPGPTPCDTAVPVCTAGAQQMPPTAPICRPMVPKVDAKAEFKTETLPLPPLPVPPPQIRYHAKPISEGVSPLWGSSRNSREYVDDEESAETARIAAELKRSAEQEMAEIEEKKPRTELAEADTTFTEDGESLSRSHHSSPGSLTNQPVSSSLATSQTSSQTLPSISSWIDSKPLSVEIPSHLTTSRSANSSPASFRNRRPPHVCDRCNRVLSSDYSLRRHRQNCAEQRSQTSAGSNEGGRDAEQIKQPLSTDPLIGHGSGSAASGLNDEEWLKREEVPDSTTCQRLDRSTSPGVLIDAQPDAPARGALQYTRKRALSGGNGVGGANGAASGNGGAPNGNNGANPQFSNDPKQARHLCQSCGKFYSSEWNLERHRRESCPTKSSESNSPSAPVGDDVSVLLGSTRFVLSRTALSRASSSFVQLFTVHDPSKGELRLDIDPHKFQSLLDVYNNPNHLNPSIVDDVTALAEKLKFNSVFECCTKYIADELPKCSVMHAIRLAEQYRLLSIKQKLFDSISIDVFRSLAADHHYKLMNAELKAELLEKWGTFL